MELGKIIVVFSVVEYLKKKVGIYLFMVDVRYFLIVIFLIKYSLESDYLFFD